MLQTTKGASLTLLGQRPETELAADAQAALARLRQAGQVDYLSLDLGAPSANDLLLDLRCDGIFHLAGVPAAGPISTLAPDTAAWDARAKTVGTDMLLTLAPTLGAEWMVVFASVIGTFGGAGYASYAMANRYQQARAAQTQAQPAAPCPLIALNWSMWEDIGMSAGIAETEFVAQKGYEVLSAPRAMRALERALEAGEANVQIGLDPTRPALTAHLCLPAVALIDQTPQSPVAAGPSLLTQMLCSLWSEVLGLATSVAEEADIFDLGATSLDLPRAQESLSGLLGFDIDVLDFFDHPTIRSFSAHLQGSAPQLQSLTADPAAGHKCSESLQSPLNQPILDEIKP